VPEATTEGAVLSGGSLTSSLATIFAETVCLERDVLDRTTAHALDRLLSRLASVERYRIIRKYVRGVVIDAACGTGYGSWILSKCPAVDQVVGLDVSQETVKRAGEEFPECLFLGADFSDVYFSRTLRSLSPDTIVSVETIEHLNEPERFIAEILGSGASRFIVTFPAFETVSFNPYHVRDWTLPEVNTLMEHEPVVAFVIDDAVQMAVYDL
jgi:SAM-dependent methyltransferase